MEQDDIKRKFESKVDEYELVEREYHKLQEKHRDLMNNEYNIQTTKEHLEASLRVAQEEMSKFNEQYEQDVCRWKKERFDLHKKLQELAL